LNVNPFIYKSFQSGSYNSPVRLKNKIRLIYRTKYAGKLSDGFDGFVKNKRVYSG
jgi:hypothetical protein